MSVFIRIIYNKDIKNYFSKIMEPEIKKETSKLSMPMAIVIAGVLIAGAIYFSSLSPKNNNSDNKAIPIASLQPITKEDKTLGDSKAKVALILYEDYQCPFCGAVNGTNEEVINYLKQKDPTWTPFMPEIINNYVKNGKVLFVYRDFPFLGEESNQASEAALCAGDQNKFWEFHDYLYSNQKGENKGNFSDTNLKSFAKTLGLETAAFDQCLDSNKYNETVSLSRDEANKSGVSGTPKGYILKNGKVVSTIEGAESLTTVKQKIEDALK
ncbi:MAG: DsbA family protein [Burkholderiales bacterium]|nr:DsbA family protein [Burkholderiales bacterium]